MYLFSLDSLDSGVLIVVSCNCLTFSYSIEVDFSETSLMTSAENSVSEPPKLKIFWCRIPPDPPTRLLPAAPAIMPPVKKNLATALARKTEGLS